MQKFYYLLLVFLLSIIACKNQTTESIVKIYETKNNTLRYSQVFDHAEIIKLQTTPECLISGINKVSVDQNRIFCFDSKLQTIFIFSNDGLFISKINAKGKGPGEMLSGRAYTLDRNNHHLEFLDSTGKSIYIYDYDGNLLKVQPSIYVGGFEKVNERTYIGYSYNSVARTNKTTIKSEIFAFNQKGKIEKNYYEQTKLKTDFGYHTHILTW
ncbi:MAG: 6-bladed beta-propeller [Bacteroidota bacterium]|nr:6-bladed beta-propeller [Bacteroidota bacterium]